MTDDKREEFEKWYTEFLVTNQRAPTFIEAYESRQPEIDAWMEDSVRLSGIIDNWKERCDTRSMEIRELKAENERLRYLKDNFVRCEPKMDGKHHWIAKGRLIGSGNTFEEAIDALMKEKK